ncbi:MAG: hydroxymethylbilane synthase [Candidatus Hydrogenedentes bacterium]|nr:hydroxymethylbilane synthase [Candidatus Hydrogenedentota bacterium]
MPRLVIGSRGSNLALTQSKAVGEMLRAAIPGLEVAIEIIHTQGDKILDAPLSQIGGKGLFTRELEIALMDGRIDLAVHSLKDLPTELPDGLALGCVPEREDPHDVFVSTRYDSLDALPDGATIGTSSLRRRAQLLAYRPDVNVVDLRGNVETRIRKVTDGHIDGTILARAGIVRIGRAEAIRSTIPESVMIPATAQGALGIEIRGGDARVEEIVSRIRDERATTEVTAERACLGALEGGCQVPIGTLARQHGASITLVACVCSLDGKKVLRTEISGPIGEAAALGASAAETLCEMGAADIIAAIR